MFLTEGFTDVGVSLTLISNLMTHLLELLPMYWCLWAVYNSFRMKKGIVVDEMVCVIKIQLLTSLSNIFIDNDIDLKTGCTSTISCLIAGLLSFWCSFWNFDTASSQTFPADSSPIRVCSTTLWSRSSEGEKFSTPTY